MKILFTQEAYQKLRAYIHGINLEISGFGKIERIDGGLKVVDIKIFQQVVSAAHTEMDARSLALFWDELSIAGEDLGKWKLWWHSHVNMRALFSQTDHDTIDDFDSELPEENWMLSIVANKLGETTAQIDIFQPFRCTIGQVPWEVESTNEQLIIDVSQEILQKVKTRQFQTQHNQGKIDWQNRVPLLKDGKILSPQQRLEIALTLSGREDLSLEDEMILEGELL